MTKTQLTNTTSVSIDRFKRLQRLVILLLTHHFSKSIAFRQSSSSAVSIFRVRGIYLGSSHEK